MGLWPQQQQLQRRLQRIDPCRVDWTGGGWMAIECDLLAARLLLNGLLLLHRPVLDMPWRRIDLCIEFKILLPLQSNT